MVYLLKNTNKTPRKIVLNCYISFFQIDTFRFAGFKYGWWQLVLWSK